MIADAYIEDGNGELKPMHIDIRPSENTIKQHLADVKSQTEAGVLLHQEWEKSIREGFITDPQQEHEPRLDSIKCTMSNGDVRYLPSGEDPENPTRFDSIVKDDEDDFLQIMIVGGHPMLYGCSTTKQFELMDALATVAGKIGNIDYLIQKIKSLPV